MNTLNLALLKKSMQKDLILQVGVLKKFGATTLFWPMETSKSTGGAPISQCPLNEEPQQVERQIETKSLVAFRNLITWNL